MANYKLYVWAYLHHASSNCRETIGLITRQKHCNHSDSIVSRIIETVYCRRTDQMMIQLFPLNCKEEPLNTAPY